MFNNKSNYFTVGEIYKLQPAGPVQYNQVGKIEMTAKGNRTDLVTKTDLRAFYQRRSDLQGLTLRISYVDRKKFAFVDRTGRLRGVYGDIIDILSSHLNFRYTLLPRDTYGSLGSDGATFNGILGDVQRGAADLGLDLVPSLGRSRTVDFTITVTAYKFSFYLAHPGLSTNYHVFADVFLPLLWLMLCMALVGVAAFIIIQQRLFHGTWLHVVNTCQYVAAALVNRELDGVFLTSQRRLSTR